MVAKLSALALAAAAAAAAPTAASAAQPNLPVLLQRQIRAIDRSGHAPPVLLPRSMALDAKRLYESGGTTRSGYDLSLAAVRNCGGATACFVAEFTAQRTTGVFGRRVHVRGASRAGFVALSCGASCSPPQIDFVVHRVRYTIQATLSTSRDDLGNLTRAAEAAIAAGPR